MTHDHNDDSDSCLIQITCASIKQDGLTVHVDDGTYKCDVEGQELSVSSQRSPYIHTGILICPSYEDVCTVCVLHVVIYYTLAY